MSKNPAVSAWHASRTPEQRAAWLANVRAGTSVGVEAWHANRTPVEREATKQRMRDAAMNNVFQPRHPVQTYTKGHMGPMHTRASLQQRALTKVQSASIKRIMRDVVATDPNLIRDAIIEGLQAPPPRSFPYLALAAAYLDGKPTPDSNADDPHADLAALSREELADLATRLAESLRAKSAPLVIDVTPEPGDV